LGAVTVSVTSFAPRTLVDNTKLGLVTAPACIIVGPDVGESVLAEAALKVMAVHGPKLVAFGRAIPKLLSLFPQGRRDAAKQ